jgi:uncharacterized Zn ribbon protein
MLTCPRCNAETSKLVIPLGGKLGCPNCSEKRSTKYNANLNQTFATYGDGNTKKLTNGKAWEIANRTVSKDDGKTIINRVTGKPTQY